VTADATAQSEPQPQANEERHWKGLAVSEGMVIGRVLRIHRGTRHVYPARIEVGDLDQERTRFRAAVALAKAQLLTIEARAEEVLGAEQAYIFAAHRLLLEDRKLIGEIEDEITATLANAEWAVKVVGDRLLARYSEIKDDYLRERGSDIEDVIHRILEALSGERPRYRDLAADAVIVAEDLLPSAVAELDLEHARAIVTDAGGWTSHTAIIARGLGIPAIVGLGDLYPHTRTGDEIIVDSYRGEVLLHPSIQSVEKYRSTAAPARARIAEQAAPGNFRETLDGVKLRLRANVELPAEFQGVSKYNAQGIGLYRSEFLLARPGVMLSEEKQYQAYCKVAELAGDEGAIVRLFDLGGDQNSAAGEYEGNPALGLRAIRFGLTHQAIMRIQVRAIMRAARAGRLDIVLPMVADTGDVRRAQNLIAEERTKLERKGHELGQVKIGVMIEVPSAVMTAAKIAKVVDFFELGTNDLVQYVLAVDRGNDKVADWFRSLHPAVLESISITLQAARDNGIPTIVCGEMASTPAYAVVLLGLGASDFSMTPSAIPRVGRALAAVDSRDAKEIAMECLRCETADEVEELVRRSFLSKWPQVFSSENLPPARS
jgi:phosphotransferase system enzyme I (PtsI)